ncbi:MAG: cytidine deaminase, partial [Clostridiales bacterium]|nr:cytidine deaminase [Clostridiales bacterium]
NIQSGIKTNGSVEDKYDGTPSVLSSKRMLDAAGVRYYHYQKSGRKLEITV